ncbi:Neuronal PAS domain-containing protein 2 [Anthophora retusa]
MWREQQKQVYLQHPQHPQQQTLHPGIIGTPERTHHHHDHHRTTTMDLPAPSNPRASRNMAEKQRRDNLNTNISAMAVLVPIVAESSRKMDKISILRLTGAFLRMRYAVGNGTVDFLPRELGDLDLEQYIIDNLIESGGFFIIVTTTGKIVYVSRKVHEHLGHTQIDLLGHSLFTYVHPKDHEELTKNLTPDEMQGMVTSSTSQITDGTNENSNSSEDSTSARNERRPFRTQRRNFELRMLHRTASRREHTQYEWFEISGMLRLADACKNSDSNAKRAKHREINSTSNDIVFVGIARLLMRRPITKISIIDANKDEYITRHLVDGRIIYCDHRVSVVAGYLSEEVSGLCAFRFMHRDDRLWAMIALRQMYDRAETCGSSCYRLTSKTGEPIYLRTHGYLEVDKDTQIAVSLVCINTLVSEEEGIKLIEQMKKRFSATVTEEAMRAMIQSADDDGSLNLGSDSPCSNSKSSVDDPSQLEDAITYLVSDLPSPLPEECLTASPVPNEQYVKAAMVSQHLPPAAAQARKLGIKKIDHYLVVQGGKTSKNQKESKDDDKHDSDSNKRQENSISSGKTIMLHDVTNQTHSVHDGAQSEQISPQMNNMITTNDSNTETYINTSRDHLDVSQNMDILSPTLTIKEPASNESSSHTFSESSPCDINVEHSMDVYKRQQEPIIDYLENVVDNTVPSDSKSHQYSLKRIYSDEEIRTSCNKKRHSNVPYVSTDTNDEQQSIYISCKPFIGEEFSELSADFNQYNNINPPSLKIAESPNSTLNEVIVDYQQVDSSVPLIPPTPEDDQFIDLHDLKDDPLLSPSLDTNPDLIMKILDDFESSFNETKVQQLTDNNAINNEIRRKHIQLMNSMALQESQLSVLAQDLKNPALQAKRRSLTPLQAEHNMQKQILETLQQHHHNIQVNIKHNIGV